MIARICVLVAAGVAGLMFAPVFGVVALALPIAVVVGAVFAVGEVCARLPRVESWRPVLAVLAGVLGLVAVLLWDTTVSGLPTGETLRALAAGITESWQLTLQSTWPARPVAELLLFVPLAVLAAAVLGVELLRWPLAALLPSLAVLGLSQAYSALNGTAATLAALAYAAVAAALLYVTSGSKRAVAVVPTALLAVAAALVGAVVYPVGPAYALRDDTVVPPSRVVSPLSELAGRLVDGDERVFTYTSDEPVALWRVAVYDQFDGAGWSASPGYHRMGASVSIDTPLPTEPRSARVELAPGFGPLLPSQPLPVSVAGASPLVDVESGMLRASGVAEYRLTWGEPVIEQDALLAPGIDSSKVDAYTDLPNVPTGIIEQAQAAVEQIRPSFQTALALEDYLRRNFDEAGGADLPTGSGWSQLQRFLDEKRGTSEQFAATYVVFARALGIPARLAVGFQSPPGTGEVVVHNRDVLAWPEVAVDGVGWVPLDPTENAETSTKGSSLGEATKKARAELPDPEDRREPEVAAEPPPAEDTSFSLPVLPVLASLGGAVLLVLLTIPVLRVLRRWRRRGVVGAWLEARERVRAHGVPYTSGMTVRDLASAAADTNGSVVDGLRALAVVLDDALWSGAPTPGADDRAWAAVRQIRRGLARLPVRTRLRAAFDPRLLRGGGP